MQNIYNIALMYIVSYLAYVTQYTNIVYECMWVYKSYSPISEDLTPEWSSRHQKGTCQTMIHTVEPTAKSLPFHSLAVTRMPPLLPILAF